MHFRLPIALPLCVLAACAAAQPSAPVVQFPSYQELQTLAASPPPKVSPPAALPAGDGWTLQGPLPAALSRQDWPAPNPALSELARAFVQVHPNNRFLQTMACAAREFGRFYLNNNAFPQEALQTFVLGACGASSVQAYMGVVTMQADPQHKDEAVAGHLRDVFTKQVQSTLGDVKGEFLEPGVWMGREGTNVVAVFVAGRPQVEISKADWLPGDQHMVRIEGRVSVQAQYIVGHVNRGRFGVDDCVTDISVPLPDFRLTCETEPDDPTSWIDVVYVRPKQVLAHVLVRALMRKSDHPLTFNLDTYGMQGDAAVKPGSDPRPLLISQLNMIRKQGALQPVQTAPLEMETAQALAPFLFDAEARSGQAADETATKIALGLLAGWRVGGTIRDGALVYAQVALTLSPTRWLSTMLQTPMARVALLKRDIEKVSIGTVVTEDPNSIQAVVTGWAFHHSTNHISDVVNIYKRIIAARERLGLPMVKRLISVADAMAENLERVNQGEETPMGALESTLQLAVGRYGANMRGWAMEAQSLDAVTIPEDIIARHDLVLEIGVTHHRPPGAAWAQYVVLITYIDEGQTAQAAPQ